MKDNRSLANQFFIRLLIIFIICQAGTVFFMLSLRESLVESLNSKMTSLSALMADVSAKPVLDNNKVLLDTYIENFHKDKDIFSITILDNKGSIIAEETKDVQETSRINPFAVKPFLESETPLFSGKQKTGKLVLQVSTRDINDEISVWLIYAVSFVGFLLVGIAILLGSFYKINIKKPIADLTVGVSRAAEGDFSIKIMPTKFLETAALIEGFNTLISRLKIEHQKLYSATNDVIMAIMQINLIIDKVTDGTNKQSSATSEVIMSMKATDKYQKDILENSQNLIQFSDENLTSLMEVKVSSEEINQSSEELFNVSSAAYSTIAEISSAAKEIAHSTSELVTSTEQISASIEEISSNTKEVENTVTESNTYVNKVRDIAADRGMLSVADAMGGMEEILNSVDKTLKLVRNLEVRSRDVEKVLTVIADVTKQTNLLSVNAAILASQAGEFGKGFAVVADEIKTLADRTASSSKEITGIIKSIQQEISETTRVTENSKLIAERGNELVVKTGEAFNDVIESSQKSSELAGSIKRATEEQVMGISQINDAMDMIRMVVEHVNKATMEHEIGSEHLLEVAEKVKVISELIKQSMKEQTSGIALISMNLEQTNKKIQNISEASGKHDKANEGIFYASSMIGKICDSTTDIAKEMSASFNILYQEAEKLKAEMEEFRFE